METKCENKTNMEKPKRLLPNFTQIPNVIFDELMPYLADSELRCLLYICRRTYGFQKEKDSIGTSQFTGGIEKRDGSALDYGTGLKERAVRRAISTLRGSGIIRVKQGRRAGIDPNEYQVNTDYDIDAVIAKIAEIRQRNRGDGPKQGTLFASKFQKNLITFVAKEVTPVTSDRGASGDRGGGASGDRGGVSPATPTKESIKIKPKESNSQPEKPAAGNRKDKEKSPHAQLVEFFHNTCKKARGLKPVITGQDARNLKRVIDMGILTQQQIEQMLLFFLGSWRYKKFAPSISTALSSGILNGLMNQMQNGDEFWKEMTQLQDRFMRARVEPTDFSSKIAELKRQLYEKIGMPKSADMVELR